MDRMVISDKWTNAKGPLSELCFEHPGEAQQEDSDDLHFAVGRDGKVKWRQYTVVVPTSLFNQKTGFVGGEWVELF